MSGNRLLYIIIAIALGGCMASDRTDSNGSGPIRPVRIDRNIEDAWSEPFISHPRPSAFSVCYGNTCRHIASVGLNSAEWAVVEANFSDKAATPAQEREHIRTAIATLEKMVGDRAGTAGDLGENMAGLGLPGQMDCVDESTNTTVYLTMLQNAGLLRWHTVEPRISRGIMTLQVPHFTAVIKDRESGIQYAVDSWFLDNGQPPFVIPVREWQSGWQPEGRGR